MKLKGTDYFYALICDDSKFSKKQKANKLLCGVFESKAEALEVNNTIKDCSCRHYIKRCKVTVDYD